MPAVVADTHAALWYILTPEKLSKPALAALDGTDSVLVATVSLVELTYLVEKGRLPDNVYVRLLEALSAPDSNCQAAPLTLAVAEAATQVSREAVPDMPDRIIAATALALDLPLVTRDLRIRATQVTTIW